MKQYYCQIRGYFNFILRINYLHPQKAYEKTTHKTFKWPSEVVDFSSGFQINDPSNYEKMLKNVFLSKIELEISSILQQYSFIVILTKNVLQLEPTRNFKAANMQKCTYRVKEQAKTKKEFPLGMVSKHACMFVPLTAGIHVYSS